ncbi:MAG TPA: methyltransferase domain-containing protein [Actinomycetota bacterium]|nr:methyltransferase domain-containing protein [Actinomycetota bacterium]
MRRGRIGFELLLGQVLDALPEPPATVVDAGGGTGQLAVALAGHGYRVTVVDTSAAMLATCAQRATDEAETVAERVATVQGDAADLPALLGEGAQDAAVCHDLLTRVEDQAALLASLAGVLTEGGVLSLGFANRDWLALRAGRRGDHTSALRLVEGGEAVTLDEATQQLDKAGLTLVAAYGVGVFAEVGDDDLGRAELAALVELERLVAGREPYRSSARTLHLIARRRVFRPELTGYTP